ncbi:hypothetical protein HYV89_03780 [Candidatus Woesearchaeota archaeon]|nr:hypothetical protein [Candidatus Woesearchaeota archaeon]
MIKTSRFELYGEYEFKRRDKELSCGWIDTTGFYSGWMRIYDQMENITYHAQVTSIYNNPEEVLLTSGFKNGGERIFVEQESATDTRIRKIIDALANKKAAKILIVEGDALLLGE